MNCYGISCTITPNPKNILKKLRSIPELLGDILWFHEILKGFYGYHLTV